MTDPQERDVLADIQAMYALIKDVEPVEPIRLTREQMDWLRSRLPETPKQRYSIPDPSPLFGTPIHIVKTVRESTPYAQCWAGWPGVGHVHIWSLGDRRHPTRCVLCRKPAVPWWKRWRTSIGTRKAIVQGTLWRWRENIRRSIR